MKLFKLLQKMKSIRVFLWASFAVGAVLSVIAQVHSEVESSAIPVAVRRRSFDFHIILQEDNTGSTNINCNVDNATYLVEENQCINNQHLFNRKEKCIICIDGNDYCQSPTHAECCFIITPNGELITSRLFLNIEMEGTATTAQTLTMNNIVADGLVALRGTAEHAQLNTSTCQISGLEVYRGREQAIEISHQGFSLSDNGSIEVR